jgi:hypothetical protein
MKNFNTWILNLTVAIIDFLYQGRDYQRFWVLEEIARAPYFAFLSVLHLRESLGLRGPEHIYLMEEHFAQTLNETEHLEYMESRGGSAYWVDRFFAKYLAYNGHDDKILEILNDELEHSRELEEAIRLIDPDHLTESLST